MRRLRLAILDLYDGTPNQGMRSIKEIADRFSRDLDWKVFDVRAKAELPDLNYDIFISSGGPGSPFEGNGEWDERFFQWIDAIWQWNKQGVGPKKHVFFICHSFQMACRHFQVGQITKRRSRSFGTFPCHKLEQGREEVLFNGLPDPFWIADFRDWQVIQPDLLRLDELGARMLAMEKIRPHVPLERAVMAIRFSDEIIGTQFHPEADPGGMIRHFLDPERRKTIIAEHSEQKYLRMIDDLNDSDKIKLTHEIILPRFINEAIRSVRNERVMT